MSSDSSSSSSSSSSNGYDYNEIIPCVYGSSNYIYLSGMYIVLYIILNYLFMYCYRKEGRKY